jgi:uncharacterized protein YjbI with pentapeptide repeats
MANPQALDLIQEEQFEAFNHYVETAGGRVDLSGAHLRGYNLRRCNLTQADLGGAYLRSADLRGLDLSQANLDGASIKEAKVSGVIFPRNLSAHEITLSLHYGTRLRQDM